MRKITISLPDFNLMSDEEMQKHSLTASLDGKWSALTRWLLDSFETDKLDLNAGWAMTWQGWACPACGREKFQIARLTDVGVLLCRLEEHHDHLGDLAGLIFKEALPESLNVDDARQRRVAFAAAYPLIERFARTLVCGDCNAADAAMKAAIGHEIDRHFSFSPSEIGRFVIAEPCQPHSIDVKQGRAVWALAKAQFDDRVVFAQSMAKRVALGRHERERSNLMGRAKLDDAGLLHRLALDQLPVRERPKSLDDALLARSKSVVVRTGQLPRKFNAETKIPTEADFATLNAARQITAPWRNAGDNWHCATCARTKFQIMRASNKGAWTANIFLLNDFREETDAESVRRRKFRHAGSLILGSAKSVSVCQDCRQAVTDAVTLVAGAEQHCLRVSDIAELVEYVRPHQRPLVEPKAIIEAVENNEEWIAAVTDFTMHQGEAIEVSLAHYRVVRNKDCSYEDAKRKVIPHLVEAGRIPAFDSEGWFDWFMAEYSRHRGLE